MRIRETGEGDRDTISRMIAERWGSQIIVTRGNIHDVSRLPGFICEIGGKLAGLITYSITNSECEITSLDSFFENTGVGSGLLESVIRAARAVGCRRVWLVTTNDNTRAIRFYQRRDFSLVAAHIGAVERWRKLKPEIPLTGIDGIPILHELEFEKRL